MVLNFSDVLKVSGKHQSSMKPPFILGQEGSGVKKKLALGMVDFKPGDRVTFLCLSSLGALADFIAIDAHQVIKIPDAMSFCLPLMLCTAYLACIAHANIRASDEILFWVLQVVWD